MHSGDSVRLAAQAVFRTRATAWRHNAIAAQRAALRLQQMREQHTQRPPLLSAVPAPQLPHREGNFEEYHHDGMAVTPENVEQGLLLANADRCPFLNQVQTTLVTDEEGLAAVKAGGAPAKKHMRNVIQKCLTTVLDRLRQEDRYREFRYLERSVGTHPEVLWQSDDPTASAMPVVNWCSNDYLNQAHHPDVLAAMQETLYTQGAGAGGTRNISGSNIVHKALEFELADLCRKDNALLFQSCYTANLGVMEGLATTLGPNTIIFSDSENHASLVQGIRNTQLPKKIFAHNDVAELEKLLADAPEDAHKVVVFESVYSMSGTKAPVRELLDICERYNAISVVDEVHALGLYGGEGGGLLDELDLRGAADVVTGTLGKAYGVGGGFVAADAKVIDVIRSTAPSFIFTTSMSPVVAAGALASVQTSRTDTATRHQLHAVTSSLKQAMLEQGIPLLSTETHIMPVLVGDGQTCKAMADQLLQRGIYVQPINYPSVPKGEELLRFTASPRHTASHCAHLLAELTDLCQDFGLLREPMSPQEAAAEARSPCVCGSSFGMCSPDICQAQCCA